MYRVLAILLMAYAICYPRIASEAPMHPGPFGPTKAERLMADFSAWLGQPIDRIRVALRDTPPS